MRNFQEGYADEIFKLFEFGDAIEHFLEPNCDDVTNLSLLVVPESESEVYTGAGALRSVVEMLMLTMGLSNCVRVSVSAPVPVCVPNMCM